MKIINPVLPIYHASINTIARIICLFCLTAGSDEFPIREREVVVANGDIQLSGTLSLPPGNGPFPTLILISGSGPQNRDWDFDMNGEYLLGRIIANDLSRDGIAVFRYDDRGVGKSTGEGEDIRALAQDVICIVQQLKNDSSIGAIGLGGHSLGAEVALRAAVECDRIQFLVLLSSPFQTGEEIMLAQARDMPEMYRSSSEQSKEEACRNGTNFVQNIAANPPTEQNRQQAISIFQNIFRFHIANMNEDERRGIGDVEKRIQEDAVNLVDHFLSPGSQFFLHYDPVDDIKKIECPVVAYFGENDRHVKLSQNVKPLLDSVAESRIRNLTLKIVPEINHFYTAQPYRSKGEMYPGITKFIGTWIMNSL